MYVFDNEKAWVRLSQVGSAGMTAVSLAQRRHPVARRQRRGDPADVIQSSVRNAWNDGLGAVELHPIRARTPGRVRPRGVLGHYSGSPSARR